MTDFSVPADRVGAFVPHNLAEPIRGAAEGPLAGRSFAVKDMFDIAGRKTGNGNPAFHDWVEPSERTAPAVQKMLDAGATCVGVTVCDEFFYSLSGANAHYGTPGNVRAPGRLPGGSSSGSAAAVAAGLCDIALGSDTGGSVRVPAAFCGTYGIRPTHGRVDATGGRAMAPSYDVAGWFADDAEIFRSVGPVLLDATGVQSQPTRLLIAEDAFGHTDPAVAEALRGVLAAAASVLPAPEPVTVAPDGFDPWREAFRILQGDEVRVENVPWVQAHDADLGPGIRERFAMAAAITPEEVASARPVRDAARARMAELLPPGTILCLPTAPVIAPPVDVSGEALEFFRANTMALTCIAGHSGLPQVSLPAAEVEGCPVGLSFIAWSGGDEALLDLAVALRPHLLR